MDDRDQNKNPMSFVSEVMDKMWGDRADHPGRAMMDAMQDAAGKAQKAQAALFENMREFMPEGMHFPGMTGSGGSAAAAEESDGDEEGNGTGSEDGSSAMDEMQKMFGQMTQPWTAFLQLDRKNRLKLMERHRALVGSYLDMLDSAIDTLQADLAEEDEDA